MYNDFIKFVYKESDLDLQPEFWQRDSYEDIHNAIMAFFNTATGFLPSKNLRPIREGVFPIVEKTTINDLKAVAKKIEQKFVIDCFQIAIDRKDNTAHMLFDFCNKKTARCVKLNRSQQIALSVLILRSLNLPRPKSASLWLRFFLTSEYSDDPKVFADILNHLKHAGLSKRKYHIARDVLKYVQMVCQGLVK